MRLVFAGRGRTPWPLWILLAAGCAGAPEADPSSDPNPRRSEIRRLIRRNLHFNLHGFKRVVDERTGPGVRRHLTQRDLPILAGLLDPDVEPESVIRLGAGATMVEFGEAARPYLLAAARDPTNVEAEHYLWTLDRRLDGRRGAPRAR